MRRVDRLTLGASLVALGLAPALPAHAQSFTVQSGQTVGPQTMASPGDTGTIEPGGTVDGAGSTAVRMLNIDQMLSNGGAITTSGNLAHGIFSNGANAWISNGGAITTAGNDALGIFSTGGDAWISNGGAITTGGIAGHGIVSTGANAWISNGGVITTAGTVAAGIVSIGANAWISNGGSITTAGDFAHGIDSSGADAQIRNCGSIHVSGAGARGIISRGANGQVTNCGTIVSEQSNAIEFLGNQDNILTLLPGSVIQGGLALGGGIDTLIVGNGLSIASTFDKAPEVLDTNGAPFAVSGTTVHVVDPTGLSLADALLADTTGAISDVLADQFGGVANGAVAVAMGNGTSLTVTPVADTGRVSRAWAQVFGGWRDRAGDAPTVGSEHLFGGVVAGVDTETGEGTRIGAFIGGAQGRVDVDHDSQEIDTESVFAGLYASRHAGAVRIDAAVTVGLADYDSERLVANNLVAGGLETAKADYDGVFISPEVTLSTAMAMGTMAVRPSLRIRYAGLWLDGYTESGSASNLTVDDRDVHILEARAQLAVPMTHMSDERGTLSTELRVGVDARTSLGSDRVDAVLLGQGISFDPGGDDEVLTGFAAAAFALAFTSGVSLTGSIEGGYGTDDTAHATARLGARIDF